MHDDPILICYDGSDHALRAIDTAAELLGRRRAVVLDVAPEVTPAESVVLTGTVAAPAAAFEQDNRDEALQQARLGAGYAQRAGFDAEARASIDAPTWQGIVEVADEIAAALIVLGSRGLSGARELFEGSLSHEVAEHAGRPVLIVPPPERRR